MDDFVKVTVTRGAAYADRFRAYRILVDGQEMGKISAQGQLDFAVPVGTHSLVARVDWCGSEPMTFTANSGDSLIFEVGSNMTGWRIFLSLFYVLFNRNRYLQMRKIE